MLEGLEASEQKWSALERTHRLDAEYFRHEFVDCAVRLGSMPTSKVTAVAKISDGNHFSISDRFLDEGIPYYRGKDVSGHFFVEECDSTFIDEATFNEKFLRRSHLRKGDILLSIVGTIGQLALVSDDRKATCSCKLAILRTKNHAKYLAIFLKSRYGALQIQRNTRGAVQMGLLLEDMDQLLAPAFSDRFMSRIDSMADAALQKSGEAAKLYEKADNIFINELGLKEWQPEDPLYYEMSSTAVLADERLDAEHYRPKYALAREAMMRAGANEFMLLESMLGTLTNGHTPTRHDLSVGNIVFLCSEHVRDFEINYESDKRILNEHHEKELARTQLQNGDLLLTIKGRVGNAAIVEDLNRPTNINQDVALLRTNSALPIWYIVAFINSKFGKLATEQLRTGQINPFLGLSGVGQLLIPVFNKSLMADIAEHVKVSVHQARAAAEISRGLIEKAQHAVEIAVERGETAATEYLDGRVYVQTQVLPAMAEQHKYFNLDALKARLAAQKLSYVPETVNAYVSRMKNEGKIFGAGRGWYSLLDTPFEVDTQPVAELVADVEKKFPFLDFSCWSTGQLNPYLHHMLGKYVSFVYVDRDAMSSVFDALQEMEYRAYLNPTRREVEKSFSVADKTVVIRPAVTKAPGDGHFARIEKLLVDLHVELETFPLIERNEFREAAQSIISQRRIELAKLFTYAAQRKVNWREIFLNSDSVIAGGGQP